MKHHLPFTSTPARCRGFTLIELLTVITIIMILVGMVTGIGAYVQEKNARSEADTIIRALSVSIDNYKLDYGRYPAAEEGTECAELDPKESADPAEYKPAIKEMANLLYDENPRESYLRNFKPSVMDLNSSKTEVENLLDPWARSYGYSTARNVQIREGQQPTKGFNPTFDLWSTADKADRDAWVSNW